MCGWDFFLIFVCVYVCVISVVDILPEKERQKKENTQRWSEKNLWCLVQRCLKLLGNLLLPVYLKKIIICQESNYKKQ